MKTERRHELQTNDLASWLTGTVDRTKPYASTFFAGLAVVAVIAAVTTWYYQRERARQSEAWSQYFSAMTSTRTDVETLEETADRYADLSVADLARLKIADQKLGDGLQILTQSRDEGLRLLSEAETIYREVQAGARSTLFQDRAAYSLAVALESQGKVAEALQQYQQVEGALAPLAQSQARRLGNGDEKNARKLYEAQELYKWLAEVKPPSSLPPGAPGIPALGPSFNIDDPTDVPFSGGPVDDFLQQPIQGLDQLQLHGAGNTSPPADSPPQSSDDSSESETATDTGNGGTSPGPN